MCMDALEPARCVAESTETSTRFSYRTNPEFSDITERVESAIYEQKFEGATADIISRELGLAEWLYTTLAPDSHCVILSE